MVYFLYSLPLLCFCLLSAEQGQGRWMFPTRWPMFSLQCFRCWMSPLLRLTLNGSSRNCQCPSLSPWPVLFSLKLADFWLTAPIPFAWGFSLAVGASSSYSVVGWKQWRSSISQEQPSSILQAMTVSRGWIKIPAPSFHGSSWGMCSTWASACVSADSLHNSFFSSFLPNLVSFP